MSGRTSATFKSWQSYWRFNSLVRTKSRFVRNQEVDEFLAVVCATAEKRVEMLPKGGQLWRAQLGNDWEPICQDQEHVTDRPIPYTAMRMKPQPDPAKEGRVNPKGIPYLYTATRQETAVAEVRPWIGTNVSVALFELQASVRVVNFASDDTSIMFYFAEPEPEKRENAVWSDIDRAFSAPVTPSDDSADYAPTQVLAEALRNHGYDGVAYRSSVGPGHNVALFNPGIARPVAACLVTVTDLRIAFTSTAECIYDRGGTAEVDQH